MLKKFSQLFFKIKLFVAIVLSLPVAANTVDNQVTHSISLPSSGYVSKAINVSWSPLPGFSFANFSFVKVGYRLNGGNYTFKDYRGASTSLILNETGMWCFIVRGWNSNEDKFGLFNVKTEQCVQINDLPTPQIPSLSHLEYYHPVNKQFSIQWEKKSNDQFVNHYLFNGTKFSGTVKSLIFSSYGGQSFSVQACNAQDKCSPAAVARVYIYASPGFVRNLTSDKYKVENDESANITWSPAGGMIPGNYYTVSLNDKVLYSGDQTSFKHIEKTPGAYRYKIGACNPSLACTISEIIINVFEPIIEGSASFNFEPGSNNQIIDPYYNRNEYLSWDVSQVINARRYKVDVLDSEKNNILGTYDAELKETNVRFKFDIHIDNPNYKPIHSVKVKLKACNNTDSCQYITSSNSIPQIKLVNWDNNPYFQGTPLHIVAIHTETANDQNNIYNKLWPRAEKGKADSLPTDGSPHYFYEINAMELMKAYMFPYNIDSESGDLKANQGITALPNESEVLFDGVVLWSNHAKYGQDTIEQNRFENTFNENIDLVAPLKTVSDSHFWRGYLDNVFGVKSDLELMKVDGNKFKTNYLFKPGDNNERISVFDAIHEVTKNTEAERGVYLILPAPYVGTTTAKNPVTYSLDNELAYKKIKNYIDEVIEQYSIFLDKVNSRGETTKVRLAGFKWGQESAAAIGEAKFAVFNELLGDVKIYIKKFSSELQLVAFVYSTMSAEYDKKQDGNIVKGNRFSEITCKENESNVKECISKYSSIKAGGFVEHFDQVFFQPNATTVRFTNKVSGDDNVLRSKGVDRETLNWYAQGLFKNLTGDSKYSIMIEYIRALGQGIHTDEKDFGLIVSAPEEDIHPSFENFKYPSYRSRLNGENKYIDGFYGDLSYYTDYIMTQFPEDFRNGNRSFLYDDNGGLAYCYTQYARGLKNACSAGAYYKKKLYKWDLVESISELRSLYSFIATTREASKKNGTPTKPYKGDNNIFPEEPIIKLNNFTSDLVPDNKKKLTDIEISQGMSVSIKSLVRARLLESIAFKEVEFEKERDLVSCSAKPKISVIFYNSENIKLDEQTVELTPQQFKYACLTYAMKAAYHNGGRGELRGFDENNKRVYGSGFWPDADDWELINGTFTAPAGTNNMSIVLEAVGTGETKNLEAYLFYRPEYKIH